MEPPSKKMKVVAQGEEINNKAKFKIILKDAEGHKFRLPQVSNECNHKSCKIHMNTELLVKKKMQQNGTKLILGRSRETGIKDNYLSKHQIEIYQMHSSDDFAYARLCKDCSNPSGIVRCFENSKPFLMKRDQDYVLYDNDVVFLLVTKYSFTVNVKRLPLPQESPNYLFYSNKIKSSPMGDFIENVHTKWYGDYEKLEERKFVDFQFAIYPSSSSSSTK